ncbi:hypothetical protein [Pontibacter cellulosilyticus]|uniref:Uncharacterized protein n=1 Tax=Pontibacter cellulosilyticus TaxID=1720253 RepID=A0A923N843_9BACT|nr:hypothetical protein [Pontibacter cellulosilyticus]MBC5992210.1 hypothetical protein [Pontibacter cellulosilyticus]
MKSQKNIEILNILLLWVGLLCLSGYLKAEQLHQNTVSYKSGTSAEELTTEEQAFPVAFSEPTAPPRTSTPPDPVLSSSGYRYSLQSQQPTQHELKVVNAATSFSTLTQQFRILPNAP